MNERLLKILEGHTEIYPYILEEKFSRVFNKIMELCETKLIEAYLLDLMVDSSGGTRQGFPKWPYSRRRRAATRYTRR